MIVNQRFFLNEDRYIIDRVNWGNNSLDYVPVGALEDQQHLRECVLRARLGGLFSDFLFPTPGKNKRYRGYKYGAYNEAESALWEVLAAIGASRLSGCEPALSSHERFDGTLKREKEGMQDFTSLALFVDDVERLLRDLYGNFDDQATDRVRRAVFDIMGRCTKCSPKDLWHEHSAAKTVDYGWAGIGVCPGDGISTNEFCAANKAAGDISLRARAVRSNPKAFSKYTVQFVKALDERWPEPDKVKRRINKISKPTGQSLAKRLHQNV